jgi:5-oxoprolinase (ATP-hydrolysing)
LLYDAVIEVDERITQYQSVVSPNKPVPEGDPYFVTATTTGETIQILRRPDLDTVSRQLDTLRRDGINSVAVAFVHSYLWGDHEKLVADLARRKGFAVSVSHELQPMVSRSKEDD